MNKPTSSLYATLCLAVVVVSLASGCTGGKAPAPTASGGAVASATPAAVATESAKPANVSVPVSELKVPKDKWKKTVVGITVRGENIIVRVKTGSDPTSAQAAAMRRAASVVNKRLGLGAKTVIILDDETGYNLSYGPTE